MSCVHYKFRSSLEYDTITFDGLAISLGELKSSIMAQKKFGKNADFDLEVTNAQTNEVYKDEPTLIPKNSSVVVRRIPVGTKSKAQIASDKSDTLSSMGVKTTDFQDYQGSFKTQPLKKTANLAKANATEEDKLKAMMSQAGEDWDPSQYVRGRGRGFSGSVPNNYVCYRCGKPGHFIRSCPTNGDTRFDVPKVKRTTGIPRMFLATEGSSSGGSSPLRPQQEDATKESKKDKSGPAVTPPTQPEPKKVPSELKCPMCNNLLTDAVLIPCCGTSYCDDCIRTYLLDDEHEHVCPACGQDNVLPDSLVINKQLRQAVNNFRNPRSSSPFMNTSQLSTLQETSRDTTKLRQEDVPTAKNLDVEKVIVGSGSPARSREGSPKVFKPESQASENSKPQPTSTAQPAGQVSKPHPKDQNQPKEGNIIKHAVQKIDGGKQVLLSSRAQDLPRPISGHPREHVPRVPGIRPPHSVTMHAPPFAGPPPAMSAPRLYMAGGPVVARSLPLKPRPVVVSTLHPPARDPFGMAVRPPFPDPFGHPDEHLPPPMTEEEFHRLQKGYKSRHRKKREGRESKRSKEHDRGRDSRERDHGRDQDDRGSDRESRGRRRGREVDYADELSQYRKIQRSRQRSSSWPRSRSRSYSRSESRSYSRSRSRSRSWSQSRSPSHSPTPEGWDLSRDPTPTSSRCASRDISPAEDDKVEEDKTRKRKKRKKHHRHKRDKKQKTSSQEDDRGGSKKISDIDDKKLKRKFVNEDNEKQKKKHKKKKKEKEDEKNTTKKNKSSLNKQQDRTKPKGETGGKTLETPKLRKASSSKKKSEEKTKLEKDKTMRKSTNLSKSKKAKLSEDVGAEQREVRKSKSNKKSSRSTKEKEKSSSDERKKKKKQKTKSKKHRKKHKHKKRSKGDEAKKKDSKPSLGSPSEELSDEAADVSVSQHGTGTLSDSSDIENGSTRSDDLVQGEEVVVSSDSESSRKVDREPVNDDDSDRRGDDDDDDNDFDNNNPENDDNDQLSNEDEDGDDNDDRVDDDDDDNVGEDDDENDHIGDKSDEDDDDGDDDGDDREDRVDDNDDINDSGNDHVSGCDDHVDYGEIQSEEQAQGDDAIIEEDYTEVESARNKEEEESKGVKDENQFQAAANHSDCDSRDSNHKENGSEERKETEIAADCDIKEARGSYQCESKEDLEDINKDKLAVENMDNTDTEEREERVEITESLVVTCIGHNAEKVFANSDCSKFGDISGKNRTEISDAMRDKT